MLWAYYEELKGKKDFVSPHAFPAGNGLVLTGGSLTLTQRNCSLVSGGHGVLVHRLVSLVRRTHAVRRRVSSAFACTCRYLRHTGVRGNVDVMRRLTCAMPVRGSVAVRAQDVVKARVPRIGCMPSTNRPACTFDAAGRSVSVTHRTFHGMGSLAVGLSVMRGTTCHLTDGVGGARGQTGTLRGVAVPVCSGLICSVAGTLRRGRHRRFAHLGIVGEVGRGGTSNWLPKTFPC